MSTICSKIPTLALTAVTLFAFVSSASAGIIGFGDFSGFQINRNDSGSPITVDLAAGSITLTNSGANEARSIFAKTPRNIDRFTASFTYQADDVNVAFDQIQGLAFVLQNSAAGSSTVGTGGAAFGGVQPSLAVVIGLENLFGIQTVVAIGQNGSIPSLDRTTPLNALFGNPIDVVVSYNGTLLHTSLTDTVTQQSWSKDFLLGQKLSSIIGSSAAYVGFTAGTRAGGTYQTISNFTFVPEPGAITMALIGGMFVTVAGSRAMRRSRKRSGAR